MKMSWACGHEKLESSGVNFRHPFQTLLPPQAGLTGINQYRERGGARQTLSSDCPVEERLSSPLFVVADLDKLCGSPFAKDKRDSAQVQMQ